MVESKNSSLGVKRIMKKQLLFKNKISTKLKIKQIQEIQISIFLILRKYN